MNSYFYTIKIDGQEYAADCRYYQWKKVEKYFGVSRSQIIRGARPDLPLYKKWYNDQQIELARVSGDE